MGSSRGPGGQGGWAAQGCPPGLGRKPGVQPARQQASCGLGGSWESPCLVDSGPSDRREWVWGEHPSPVRARETRGPGQLAACSGAGAQTPGGRGRAPGPWVSEVPRCLPRRNQAMRKKLILYFKRRNHARKQWVSRPADPPRPPPVSRPGHLPGTPRPCRCLGPQCPGCEEKPRTEAASGKWAAQGWAAPRRPRCRPGPGVLSRPARTGEKQSPGGQAGSLSLEGTLCALSAEGERLLVRVGGPGWAEGWASAPVPLGESVREGPCTAGV